MKRISIVVRTLNEARYLDDLLVMIGRQNTPDHEVETVVIDSGSTDTTVAIAQRHGCKLAYIKKDEFSFGRSLNRGCAASSGDILVFVSGHCIPVGTDWLQNLCRPVADGVVTYSYGRQIGDDDSNFSERRIFAKYFPDTSAIPQIGFFCNNANAALLRSAWETIPFDETLTGLEDMEFAKRLVSLGHKIGYAANAPVFHHHTETWPSVRRRFEREALALRSIMPEVHLSFLDVLRCFFSSVTSDWAAAWRTGVRSTTPLDMMRYRWNQYVGSYKGNNQHRRLSQSAKERFFYPQIDGKGVQDDWLRPLRRTSPHESQQPTRKGEEFPNATRKTAVRLDT